MKSLYYYVSALVIATFLVVSCKTQNAQKATTDITGKHGNLQNLTGSRLN